MNTRYLQPFRLFGIVAAFIGSCLCASAALAAGETELKLFKDAAGNRALYSNVPGQVGWWRVRFDDGGYHTVTNCGLKATGPGIDHAWRKSPLAQINPNDYRGLITSPDQCHMLMGHQSPAPQRAGQVLRGNSGDWNWFISKSGEKHGVHSRSPLWRECGIGKIKSQMESFDTIFRISGPGELTDKAICQRLTAELQG